MRRLLPVVVAVVGCSAAPTPAPALHWPESMRPIDVRVSSTMSEACQVATLEALAFWQGQVSYLRPAFVAGDPTPWLGEITISEGEPRDPGATAQTEREALREDRRLLWARITVRDCSAQTIGHELGHALGLEHRIDDPDALMWPASLPGGWELSEDELGAVQ